MPVRTFTDNLGHITDFGLAFRPDSPALLQPGSSFTYRELDRRINQVANGLIDTGVRAGDRVMVLWENDIRFFEAVLGAIRAGAVAVPVNPGDAFDKHLLQLQDSDARVVLASPCAADRAALLAATSELLLTVAVDGRAHGTVDYEQWRAAASTDRPSVPVSTDATAWLPYTSGTTGRPKGVRLSHRMLLRDVQLVSQSCFISTEDRVAVATPLFHMNASASGVLPTLYAGGSAYVLPGFDSARMLTAIEEQRCTFTVGVPAMYKMLLAQPAARTGDFDCVRMMCCGSAPMPPALVSRLTEVFRNARFVEGYGLTECGPVATLNPLAGPRRFGSIGRPLPGIEARTVNPGGSPLPAGETGELWLRTEECVSLGYLGRPEEDAKRRQPDGWFATGDLAMMDDDGWLYFRGRVDDMMNVGGENVYPAEVESVLARHPLVRDVTVVPAPHPTKGEVPIAYVVREPGGGETDDLTAEDDLKRFFIAESIANAHPRRIFFLPEIPLAATGKADRVALTTQSRETFADTAG